MCSGWYLGLGCKVPKYRTVCVLELSVTLNLGEGKAWGTGVSSELCPDGEQRGGCGGDMGPGLEPGVGGSRNGLDVGLSNTWLGAAGK